MPINDDWYSQHSAWFKHHSFVAKVFLVCRLGVPLRPKCLHGCGITQCSVILVFGSTHNPVLGSRHVIDACSNATCIDMEPGRSPFGSHGGPDEMIIFN